MSDCSVTFPILRRKRHAECIPFGEVHEVSGSWPYIYRLSKHSAALVLPLLSEGQKRLLRSEPQGKLRVLAPLLEFARHPATSRPLLQLPDGDGAVRTLEPLVQYLARWVGVSEKTLWRWYGSLLSGGYTGLAHAQRADRDVSRWFERNKDVAEYVTWKVLHTHWSASQIYEALCFDAGGPRPCLETLKQYVNRIRAQQKRDKRVRHE